MNELNERHDNQLDNLEKEWREPKTIRKYSKRSVSLLNNQYIERHYALIGDFDQANEVHKINQRTEKAEIKTRHNELNSSFDNARENLLANQNLKEEIVLTIQNDDMNIARVEQEKEFEKLQKRKNLLEGLITEEGDMNNFAARKFKKSSNVVLPSNITVKGGVGLPPNPEKMTRDVSNMVNFRQSPVATPLQLPPLTVKKLKRKKKQKAEKKKKKSTF